MNSQVLDIIIAYAAEKSILRLTNHFNFLEAYSFLLILSDQYYLVEKYTAEIG